MTNKPRNTKTGRETSITAGALYFEDVCQCTLGDEIAAAILEDPNLTAIRVVSLSNNWVERVWYAPDAIGNERLDIGMTLRKERRGQIDHWYAYRRVFGKLYKRYVGHSEDITEARLVAIAQVLPRK